MNTKNLKEILTEKSVSFTKEELQKILDEELEKGEDEMDVELIDQCLELLDNSSEKDSKEKRKRKIKTKKILLIAAIIAVLLCIAVPVGAKFVSVDASGDVVEYNGDSYKIDMSKDKLNSITDINSLTQQINIEKIALPASLLVGNYTLSDINEDTIDNLLNTINFTFKTDKLSGIIYINEYQNGADYENYIGKFSVPDNYQYFKQLKINSFDVLVYSDDVNSVIYYYCDNCEYRILLPDCKYDTAVSLSETLDYV